MSRPRVLVVDDETPVREGIVAVLAAHGFQAVEADGGLAALDRLHEDLPDAMLLDLKMPGMDGLATLESVRRVDGAVPVIVVTAHGDVESAVRAMKLGAYDFLEKPPEIEHLVAVLTRAVEKRRLETRIRRLEANAEASLSWVFGRSRAVHRVIEQIRQVAWSDLSVIVQGETGTGKSVVARAIHNESPRSDGPFVTVDLGAVPESLVESHLFGHERGAFTGADRRRDGVFRRASGGTLFLDELQNVPPRMQGKLLSAVEERRVFPLGGRGPVDVDVRIIGATNADIRQAVRRKHFRDDLFYRLGEFMIDVPPLRARREDIDMLARRFLEEAAAEMKRPVRDISEAAAAMLENHDWPGNVRELKNVMRQAVVLAPEEAIAPSDLKFVHGSESAGRAPDDEPAESSIPTAGALRPLKEGARDALRSFETRAVRRALRQTGGNKSRAARLLKVDYKTLLKKIRDYGLDNP